MATTPQTTGRNAGPDISDAFTADRALFLGRFITFTKVCIVALVLLLIGLWMFVA